MLKSMGGLKFSQAHTWSDIFILSWLSIDETKNPAVDASMVIIPLRCLKKLLFLYSIQFIWLRSLDSWEQDNINKKP